MLYVDALGPRLDFNAVNVAEAAPQVRLLLLAKRTAADGSSSFIILEFLIAIFHVEKRSSIGGIDYYRVCDGVVDHVYSSADFF